MEIKCFVVNPIGENCYVLSSQGEAAIIDCGAHNMQEWSAIKDYLTQQHLTLRYALQTHMHFDHIFGLPYIAKDYNVFPLCHAADLPIYQSSGETLSHILGTSIQIDTPPVERFLSHHDTLPLGELTLQVRHTPGHTPGGLCFYVEQESILFSGDTLFQGSIGRTDLPGGSQEQEIASIHAQLLTLPDTVRVFPGHGPSTTISYERAHNPYL